MDFFKTKNLCSSEESKSYTYEGEEIMNVGELFKT